MTGDAVAAELETMRNWWGFMIIRRASELWPRQWLPRCRRISPTECTRCVTLPASRAWIRARKRDRHQLDVADVTLKADAHLGMRSDGHICIEAMRVSAALVARGTSASQRFTRRQSMRDSGWSSGVCAQRAIRCQCARMRSSPDLRRRIDREYGCLRPKDVGFGRNRIAGNRYRRRSGIADRCIAIHRDAFCRDNEGGDRNDCRDAEHHGDQDCHSSAATAHGHARTRSMRTAHVVVSGWPESGQKESSISLCTGCPSSNEGTKT